MALQVLNLLKVTTPTGLVQADLEYNDVTLACTRVFGSNTGNTPYNVVIKRVSDGATVPFTLAPHSTPSTNLPGGFLSVTVTPDDVLPPISVTGS